MTRRSTHAEPRGGRRDEAAGGPASTTAGPVCGPTPVPKPEGRIYNLGIWWLAVGYCALYAPYSALVRATSQGLWPGVEMPTSPFVILPAVGVATAVVATSIVTWLGWWRYCDGVAIGRWWLPRPTRPTIVAGIATAAIIYSTTLMFTFRGVSIVLALLIMRGGVLVLAPILDVLFGRRVRWFAWTGFLLSLGAVAASAAGLASYPFDWVLATTAGTYLVGYVIRLRAANVIAKTRDRDVSCRYFVEEQFVAMTALVAAPLVLAAMGNTSAARQMREGVTTFVMTPAIWPALGIGALYAALYVFGTLIYLDRRENTFCVALNRSASLLAGVAASLGLAAAFGTRPPGAYELTGVALISVAIVVMSPLHHWIERLPAFQRGPRTARGEVSVPVVASAVAPLLTPSVPARSSAVMPAVRTAARVASAARSATASAARASAPYGQAMPVGEASPERTGKWP
jgi:hypothetical protein